MSLRLTAGASLVLLALAVGGAQASRPTGSPDPVVGRQADGSVVLPTGQSITPTGTQAELPGRPNEVAVRPGGGVAAVLVASSGTQLRTLDTSTGRWLSASSALAGDASYAGLVWAPDGRTLFASGAAGSIVAVAVDAAGTLGAARTIAVAPVQSGLNAGQNPYPGGLAVSADGRTLYVALSRDNALGVIDVATGALSARVPVGNAPHSVVVSGGTAWVTNEGGRPSVAGDTTNDSAGTKIVSDAFTGAATTGTVSKVDLTSLTQTATVSVGLHPTALELRGNRLLVANTNSDTLSVLDAAAMTVTVTVPLTPFPGAPVGSAPTGIVTLPDGRVAVSLGLDDAVGVVELGTRPRLAGLVPTAWYPSDVDLDSSTGQLVVANLHGVGTTADADAGRTARGMGEVGSVSLLAAPGAAALKLSTRKVYANDHFPIPPTGNPQDTQARDEPDRDSVVPSDGRPSPITHVIYVIKENRTYDQLLGDLGRGNGDPSLAQFGKRVTPNTHALATQFPLMDNFYDSGRRSNDGHQWAVQAAAPDYLEKGVSTRRTNVLGLGRGTPPSSGFDSLLYQQSGFLWENALRHGLTFDDYGEYTVEDQPPPAVSDIPSLQAHVVPEFSGFELTTPDVARARIFRTHLAAYEAAGAMPNLIQLTLPNDHTGGSNPAYPTPETQVADNDQALGQIVDAVSHSSFWKSTAIFVVEDDTQGGPDHVEGHRGPLLVVSPYARHGGYIDSHLYTQVSVVGTIEALLGLPPMNQLDAAAPAIRSAFTSRPDLTPYTALVPDVLAAQNPPLPALSGMQLLWARASQGFDSRHLDAVSPALLNRDIWYAGHRWAVPYPGDAAVLTPDQVLTRFPAGE